MAIYGVIVAIILSTRLESPFAVRDAQTGLFPIQAMTAGYAIYGSGITTGWSNLVCGCVIKPQASPLLGLPLVLSVCSGHRLASC